MKKILLLLATVFCCLYTQAQTPLLVHKVLHGPDSTRYNFLVTGEGFTAAQLGRLEAAVDTLAARMFRTTPFKEYKNFFNFHLIKLASPDSGLVHPATAPNETMAPYFPVNNFDTRLDYAGVHHMTFMYNPVAWNSMIANYYPGWDNIIHFNNSSSGQAHAGFGTSVTMSLPDLTLSFQNTAMHELGHAMGGLADEYWINTYPAGRPNRDTINDPNQIKWKNWIGTNGVGIDSFGKVGNTVHYRPTPICRMRSASSPFCSVCIEGLIDTLYHTVTPIELAQPNTDTVQASALLFTLKLIYPQPNTLKLKWELNGNPLIGADTFMNISSNQLQTGYNKLTAYVTDTTLLSRSYWPGKGYQFSKSWMIEKNATGISVQQHITGRFFYKLYPNPAKDKLTISYENRDGHKQLHYEIATITGQLVSAGAFEATGDGEKILELSNLPAGSYLLRLNGKDVSVEEKFIKQ